MDSSVSRKDEIWFLRVCHRISAGLYPLETAILYAGLLGGGGGGGLALLVIAFFSVPRGFIFFLFLQDGTP